MRDDNALGAVNDESAVRGHERHIDHVYILLLDVADGAEAGCFVDVEGGEAQCYAQGSRVGHAALLALFNVIFRFFQLIAHEVDFGAAGEVLDREYGRENFLQAFVEARGMWRFALEEFLVGIALNLNQVRHFADFRNFSEGAADAFASGKALAVVECSQRFFGAHDL